MFLLQVQCSVGFNITSSIMTLIGIALYIIELAVFEPVSINFAKVSDPFPQRT